MHNSTRAIILTKIASKVNAFEVIFALLIPLITLSQRQLSVPKLQKPSDNRVVVSAHRPHSRRVTHKKWIKTLTVYNDLALDYAMIIGAKYQALSRLYVNFIEGIWMTKTVLNTALWTALVVSLGVSVSACSGDADQVMAVDRVDAAADTARQKAPEAEDFGFAETAPLVIESAEPVEDVAAVAESTDEATSDAVEVSAETDTLAANAGEELYNNACTACHANGLLNSPKFGDTAAWAPRIAQGLDTLTLHSAKGFNQMPAQAINGVSEEQVRAAVEYMVDAAS